MTHNEQGVEHCPLCKILRPDWCRSFESEGHQPLVKIPVCIQCADVIADYMIHLRSD